MSANLASRPNFRSTCSQLSARSGVTIFRRSAGASGGGNEGLSTGAGRGDVGQQAAERAGVCVGARPGGGPKLAAAPGIVQNAVPGAGHIAVWLGGRQAVEEGCIAGVGSRLGAVARCVCCRAELLQILTTKQ
jgi:hypothetical protein